MKTVQTKTTKSQAGKTKTSPFFKKEGGQHFFQRKADGQSFFQNGAGSSDVIQTKLTIGPSDDVYEKEADHVADHVVRRCAEPSIQRKPIFESENEVQPKIIQRKCAACEQDELQKKGNDDQHAPSDLEGRLNASAGSGAKLPHDLRGQMESSFGADFGNVRIHTSSADARMSQDIGAQAFTHGSDIYFNSGKYNTSSTAGKHLLAHELTHVVQQSGQAGASPVKKKKIQRAAQYFYQPPAFKGTEEHKLISNDIRDHSIVTNAPIPNAKRYEGGQGSHSGYGLKGYVDLYTATPSAIMGVFYEVEGQEPKALPRRGTRRGGEPYIGPIGPRVSTGKDGKGEVTGIKDAPQEIALGEIKPINEVESHAGAEQLQHYKEGIELASKEVNQGSTGDKWNPSVRMMTETELTDLVPDRFREGASPGYEENTVRKYHIVLNLEDKYRRKDERIVKARLVAVPDKDTTRPGVLTYSWIPIGEVKKRDVPKSVKDLGEETKEKVVEPLKQPMVSQKDDDKGKVSKKKAPGFEEDKPRQEKDKPRGIRRSGQKKVQRAGEFDLKTWKRNKKEVERKYKAIKGGNDFKDAVSTDHQLKANELIRKHMGDHLANRQSADTPEQLENLQYVPELEFWGNPLTRLFGPFKRLLGKAYDVFMRGYNRLKSWVQGIIAKITPKASFGSGLPGAALKAVFNVLKVLARVVMSRVVELFKQDMYNAIGEKLTELIESAEDSVMEYIESKLKPLEDVIKSFEGWIGNLIGEYDAYFKTIEEVMKAVKTIEDVISLVRWAARVVECLSPPLVGCLWMIAQAALEKAASYVVETCWFRKKIAPLILKVPTVQGFAQKIHDILKDFMIKVLPTGITDFFFPKKAAVMKPLTADDLKCGSGGGGEGDGEPGGGELTADQEAVLQMQEDMGEEKFRALLDLLQKAKVDKDTKMSADQVRQLASAVKNMSAAEIEKMADSYVKGDTEGVPVSVQEAVQKLAAGPKGQPAEPPDLDAAKKEQEVAAAEARKDAREAAKDNGVAMPSDDQLAASGEPAAYLLGLLLNDPQQNNRLFLQKKGRLVVNDKLVNSLENGTEPLTIYDLQIAIVINEISATVRDVRLDQKDVQQLGIVLAIQVKVSDNLQIAPGTFDKVVRNALWDPASQQVTLLGRPQVVEQILAGIRDKRSDLTGQEYTFSESGFNATLNSIQRNGEYAELRFTVTGVQEGKDAGIYDFDSKQYISLQKGKAFMLNEKVTEGKTEQTADDDKIIRKCACEEEESLQRKEETVQRKEEGGEAPTVQLSPESGGLIQRQPPKPTPMTVSDAEVVASPELGQTGIGLYGEPWIQVKWNPQVGSQPDIRLVENSSPRIVSIEIDARYDIDITVNRHMEEQLARVSPGGAVFNYKFLAKGHVVTVNKHLDSGRAHADGKDNKDSKQGKIGVDKPQPTEEIKETHQLPGLPAPGDIWDPEKHITPPEKDLLKEPADRLRFYWLFHDSKQMEAFIAGWPKWNWITQTTPEGEFLAIHLDENGMQAAADKIRKQSEPGFSAMYLEGKRKDAWLIYDMFYSARMAAKHGGTAETEECLIYRHGEHSFGRVSLDHSVALLQWTALDNKSVGDAETMKVGDYPFEALIAKGASGQIHEIDLRYLRERDGLFADTADKRRKDDQGGLFSSSPSWEDVLQRSRWFYYLNAALDRSDYMVPQDLHSLLTQNQGLYDVAGQKLIEQVEADAKMEGALAVEGALMGISIYDSEAAALRLAQKMIFMKEKELTDTLQFIGIPPGEWAPWIDIFSDQRTGMRVYMGETIIGVSTYVIRDRIHQQVTNLDTFKSAIESGDLKPLYMEGGFGDEIRRIVYKKYAFNLAPEDFPHESGGDHLPVGAGVKGFEASAAGWIFARAVAADAKHKRHMKYLKITALVAASVLLVIVAGAAGVAVAGIIFGTEAAGAALVGFVATELVVSAGVVTLASPAMQTLIMSGGSASVEDYKKAYGHLGRDFGINLLTFGFFKTLGVATRALALASAGGKEAFEASKAWQAADLGMRAVSSGGAMIGIGVLNNYIQTGKIPEGAQMNELLFETALSVVLLEVGAYAARGPMKQLQEWSREVHLGEFKDQIDAVLRDASGMRARVAEFAVRPNEAKASGPELVTLQKELLIRQKQLLTKMSGSIRFRSDAKFLEAQLKEMTGDLDLLIEQLVDVEFFTKAKIRPTGGTRSEMPVFTYDRGGEQEIIDYYGKENVRQVKGGLEVTRAGRKMFFRVSTELDPTLRPDGTREAQVLDTWRASLARRKLAVLEKAYRLAIKSKELEQLQEVDASKMEGKDLAKMEGLLDRAESTIARAAKKQPSSVVKDVRRQPGESTESWRLRLVEIRDAVVRRGELLGADSIIEYIRKMPTGNSNLKVEATLTKHADAIEQADKMLDEYWQSRFGAELAVQPAMPEKDTAALKEGLGQRQEELKRRAEIYDSSDAKEIKAAMKDLRVSKLGKLRQIEADIEKAEAHLDEFAAKALEAGTAKFGKAAIDAARKGDLAGMSDQQVGDVLRMLRNAQSLSPTALRAAFYASLKPPAGSAAATPVPLERIVGFARSNAELNFVLESYIALKDAGVQGAFKLMRNAANSADTWKGAVWQLEIVRNVIGTDRVAAVEFKGPGRDIDILLKDGKRIEAKDWDTSSWDEEKVKKQFKADLEGATSKGQKADGIKDIFWMFRDPLPVSRETMLTTMKAALEEFISAKLKTGSINQKQAELLRNAFNKHDGLFSAPKIDAQPGASPGRSPVRPTLPPPMKRKDEDDK